MSTKIENGAVDYSGARNGDSPRLSLLERLRSLLGLGPVSLREDLEDALEETSGDVTAQERALLKNVLGLHELRVADVMIPRADIVAVPLSATLREVLAVFRSEGHSRLPVFGETLDDPRGMVHIRDFVNYLAECAAMSRLDESGEKQSLSVASIDFGAKLEGADILRPVLYVPRSMPALDLLVRMQATRTHMALVIDEYGGADGLASIEDIVETIVGDIEDEHDVSEGPAVERLANGDFLVDAKADLDEATQEIGVDFREEDTPQEVTTFGGLVAFLAGRVPIRGEIVPAPVEGYEFEILEADPRRVGKLKVRRIAATKAAKEGE
ncbi:hemolysin family protein [Methylocystis heyeri]|uniref:CBS domain-containing protein n=1 Tax=Methylocystis heyeri TaxID=391905 RepID=A0A6B8KEF5_9HYPH|nr:hemolysin family protein [Methylocystis heyeri]QGM45391.1 CBS domain-containing protein [Methylocystis heyeri]